MDTGRVVNGRLAATVAVDKLNTVAKLTEAVDRLPAVATLDWCDLAAGSLTHLRTGSTACVLVATVEGPGRITDLEAAGVAQSSPAARAVGDSTTDPDGAINELRCQAEFLPTIGWFPGDRGATGTVVGLISEAPGGAAWQHGPLAKLWNPVQFSDLLVGVTRLGNSVPGRSLVVYIATPARSAPFDHEDAAVLQSILPALGRRALQAIGSDRSRRNHWLSPKEQAVLDRLILGMSVRQIADELERSQHTVHDHVKSLHRKLNASSRGELIARALGFIQNAQRIRRGGAEIAREVEIKPTVITDAPPAAHAIAKPGTAVKLTG